MLSKPLLRNTPYVFQATVIESNMHEILLARTISSGQCNRSNAKLSDKFGIPRCWHRVTARWGSYASPKAESDAGMRLRYMSTCLPCIMQKLSSCHKPSYASDRPLQEKLLLVNSSSVSPHIMILSLLRACLRILNEDHLYTSHCYMHGYMAAMRLPGRMSTAKFVLGNRPLRFHAALCPAPTSTPPSGCKVKYSETYNSVWSLLKPPRIPEVDLAPSGCPA